MTLLAELTARSGGHCELCPNDVDLDVFVVPSGRDGRDTDVNAVPHLALHDADQAILACLSCREQLNGTAPTDTNHWRCLSDAMWSSIAAVQVVAYRQLHALSSEPWAQDNLDMLYLEDDVKAWADAGLLNNADADGDATPPTLDANGTVLQAGDSVTIIKDLPVKGGGFTAKRGTAVRNISLTDNPEYIEGRVSGQRIVLVAKFLKKM